MFVLKLVVYFFYEVIFCNYYCSSFFNVNDRSGNLSTLSCDDIDSVASVVVGSVVAGSVPIILL